MLYLQMWVLDNTVDRSKERSRRKLENILRGMKVGTVCQNLWGTVHVMLTLKGKKKNF